MSNESRRKQSDVINRASDRERFLFSPVRSLMICEILLLFPFAAYFTALSIMCYFVWYALTADSQDYNGVGAAIGAGMFSGITLACFCIVNFFTLIYFFNPNAWDIPKGWIVKGLCFLSLVTIPILLWVFISP